MIQVIDINILALIMLAFIFIDARQRGDGPQHSLFMALAYVLAALLVLDSLGRMFDGMRDPVLTRVNFLSNVALYILVPVAPSLWVLYVYRQIYTEPAKLKAPALILLLACLFNAALTVVTIFNGAYFTVDAANVYHRGPLFIVHMALSFLITAFPVAVILRNKKRLEERRFKLLLAFPIPTVIGSVLQSLFYGTTFIWSAMTVSMLIIYLSIQAERLGTDYLTGVYNRRQLDSLVRERVLASSIKKTFSAILIDLDNFKQINDECGHAAGDEALLDTVRLLKGCLRRGDHISRYGGDEFIIILDIDEAAALTHAVDRIRESFEQYNLGSGKPYRLSFSTGAAVYDPAGGMQPEAFIKHIDLLMYEDKRNKGKAQG